MFLVCTARLPIGKHTHLAHQAEYNVRHFLTENAKLAEMEFYLVDELECDLVVFHPYRTLMMLVKDTGTVEQIVEEKEAGELGAGIDDGPRYWGTGEGRLDLHRRTIQDAWYTFRLKECLPILTTCQVHD